MFGGLLLDKNLSPRIARALATQFPGTVHVRDVELKGQSDHIIWNFAAKNGFTIATKDDDFRILSLLHGIAAFIFEPNTALLTLRKP